MRLTLLRAILLTCSAVGLFGCKADNPPTRISKGNPARGRDLIATYGCGGCHEIPGLADADGKVGPPLKGVAERVFIAGVVRNNPDNMSLWIEHPQHIVPGNAMPDMGVSAEDARDLTAYLYEQK